MRDKVLSSNLQEALIRGRIIAAESQEIMITFIEDQLMMDAMMNTIVQTLRGRELRTEDRVDSSLDKKSLTIKSIFYEDKNLFKTQESS